MDEKLLTKEEAMEELGWIDNKTKSSGNDIDQENNEGIVNRKVNHKITLFIIILIIIGISLYFYHVSKAKQAEIYETELKNVVLEMYLQADEAEEMIGTYSKVWQESIERKLTVNDMGSLLGITRFVAGTLLGKIIVDPSFSPSFKQNELSIDKGNFNVAIKVTHEHYKDNNDMLRTKSNEISSKVKSLNKPPKEYAKSYEIVFELYSLYEEYISLAISPSSSLMTYNQKANQLSLDIIKKYNEFEVRLP